MDSMRWVCVGLLLLGVAGTAWGLDAQNVLVLYNASNGDGAVIAENYSQARPGVSLLALQNVPKGEEIGWDAYLNTIRPQVQAALTDQIDCIVTTRGLPLRIKNPGTGCGWKVYSSLESELTRIDSIDSRELMGNQSYFMPEMWGGNPLARNEYYKADGGFSYAQYGTRLASRLDGFCVEDVLASINRAGRAVIGRPGTCFVLDDDPNAPGAAADRMEALAGDVLLRRGLPCLYDQTDQFVPQISGEALAYVTHGVYGGAPEGYLRDRDSGVAFDIAPGAIFHSWESYNACSFTLGGNRYGQSLLAEWIARGGTAAVGQVEEPCVGISNVTNEDRLFEMLLQGYTFAEAAWNATMQLSFVNTVVGDPLMRYLAWVPGDVDGNGIVSDSDYTVWADNYGSTGATWEMCDLNDDGVVTDADYTILADCFGEGPVGYGVPEPAGIVMTILGGMMLLRRRRR
jgi:uncharacterized protein (TIGR03790 family)